MKKEVVETAADLKELAVQIQQMEKEGVHKKSIFSSEKRHYNTLLKQLKVGVAVIDDEYQLINIQNMLDGKSTAPKEQLTDSSLIKWENRDNKNVLRIARELIFVAYNALGLFIKLPILGEISGKRAQFSRLSTKKITNLVLGLGLLCTMSINGYI